LDATVKQPMKRKYGSSYLFPMFFFLLSCIERCAQASQKDTQDTLPSIEYRLPYYHALNFKLTRQPHRQNDATLGCWAELATLSAYST